ncbi:Serine/threonine-protein phosphatase, partial [Fasciolopsis buskii]
ILRPAEKKKYYVGVAPGSRPITPPRGAKAKGKT